MNDTIAQTDSILMVVDGNSLMYRAFYALPPLTNNAGEYTHAVFGFFSMLISAIDSLSPTHLAVAFDMKGKNVSSRDFRGIQRHAQTHAARAHSAIPDAQKCTRRSRYQCPRKRRLRSGRYPSGISQSTTPAAAPSRSFCPAIKTFSSSFPTTAV